MPLLILLVAVFLAVLAVTRILKRPVNYSLAGRIAMAVMVAFTGVFHFIFTKGMILMLPAFIPMKKEVVLATGVIEILAAIGLVVNKTARLSGILLIIFYLAILPSNIYAAMNRVNLADATYDGPGMTYLFFRIPLQVFFILWTYWFAVRRVQPSGP